MAQQRRRGGSPHPGVVLQKRTHASGNTSWRAIFCDPDKGEKERRITLEGAHLSTATLRKEWAVNKSKALAKRRAELAHGAPLKTETPLTEAIQRYRTAAANQIAPGTLETYGYGIKYFEQWAENKPVRLTEDLSPVLLSEFRDYLVGLPKSKPAKGKKKGAQKASGKRSPVTINSYLTHVRTLLQFLRRRGVTPLLNSEAITDNLPPLPELQKDPEFLRPEQITAAIEAAILHDLDTFKETRKEHAGNAPKGVTYRYPALLPVLLFLLFAGSRRLEARQVKWGFVNLDARDNRGKIVGEIRLPAAFAKDRRDRTIGLEVSPFLRTLLLTMKKSARPKSGEESVFGENYTDDMLDGALKRLRRTRYGAPRAFTWKRLRATADTFLVNAPGIFGSASTFLAPKQIGHSVEIAEKHYQGIIRGIPKDATTLEAAMEIEPVLQRALEVVQRRLDSVQSA